MLQERGKAGSEDQHIVLNFVCREEQKFVFSWIFLKKKDYSPCLEIV